MSTTATQVRRDRALWKTGRGCRAGGRWAAWLAFVLGICLSSLNLITIGAGCCINQS